MWAVTKLIDLFPKRSIKIAKHFRANFNDNLTMERVFPDTLYYKREI